MLDGDDEQLNRSIPRPSSAKGQRRRPKNEDGDGKCMNHLQSNMWKLVIKSNSKHHVLYEEKR